MVECKETWPAKDYLCDEFENRFKYLAWAYRSESALGRLDSLRRPKNLMSQGEKRHVVRYFWPHTNQKYAKSLHKGPRIYIPPVCWYS